MAVVGGLRSRFVYDSVYNALRAGIEELGWFNAGRNHLPVSFIPEPLDSEDEVQLNTVAMGEGPMFDREREIGSNMSAAEYSFFIDVYAESGPVGRALANDIRDLVMGRHGGRTGPTFTIWDYRKIVPLNIGWLDVERVNIYREDTPTRPWQKFWYTVRFDVTDDYMADDGDEGEGAVAGIYNIEVDQGATLSRTITWKNADGTPMDLTGYTALMHVRESVGSATVELELSTENGRLVLGDETGTVQILVDAATTSAMAAKTYKYDLEMVSADSPAIVTRLIEGDFKVRPEVTR